MLENESRPLATGGGDDPLYIVGVGSTWAKNAKIDRALLRGPRGRAARRLAAQPEDFWRLPPSAPRRSCSPGTRTAARSGSPLLDAVSWLDIAQSREVIADGWASHDQGNKGNRAYVSRGTGFSTIPTRLFCRPELTFFTLEAGEPLDRHGHQ